MALPSPALKNRPAFLSQEEGRKLFDHVSREMMGMPGPEFLARFDAGEFDTMGEDTPEGFNLQYLIMLIPFGR